MWEKKNGKNRPKFSADSHLSSVSRPGISEVKKIKKNTKNQQQKVPRYCDGAIRLEAPNRKKNLSVFFSLKKNKI